MDARAERLRAAVVALGRTKRNQPIPLVLRAELIAWARAARPPACSPPPARATRSDPGAERNCRSYASAPQPVPVVFRRASTRHSIRDDMNHLGETMTTTSMLPEHS